MSVVMLLGRANVVLSDARAAGVVASSSIGISYANVVGWLNGNVGLIASLRFIPTGVGNSQFLNLAPTVKSVHPHGRGELIP